MTSTEIKQLQDKLVAQGYMSQAEVDTGYGILGPKTTAALNNAEAGRPPKYAPPGNVNNQSGDQPYSDEEYNSALNAHPIIQASVAQGNTSEDLAYAAETGDFSGLLNQFGQPFSLEDQQEALAQAEEDNNLYYEALKSKETADTEAALAAKQAAYQDYLLTSGQNFQEDKGTLDQTAANSGVLFSGGRKQKESNLQRGYEQEQATKLRNLTADIGQTARDYQYAYGNDATKGLSSYFKAGGNVYNPNVATGGVSSGGLSSIYKPNAYNYQGTRNVEKKAAAQKRAAGLLWNKGNKLLSTSYNNQY
jgi:hypothetical protein